MGANIEIRQRGTPRATPATVGEEALSGQEGSFPRQRVAAEGVRRKDVIEILDALKAY